MSICMTCGDDWACLSCGECAVCTCYCPDAISPSGQEHHAMNCECEEGFCEICDNRSKYIGGKSE